MALKDWKLIQSNKPGERSTKIWRNQITGRTISIFRSWSINKNEKYLLEFSDNYRAAVPFTNKLKAYTYAKAYMEKH